MSTGQFLLGSVIMGLVVAGLSVAAAAWLGWRQDVVMVGGIALGIGALQLFHRRQRVAQARWPDPDARHRMLGLLALGGWALVLGLALSHAFPDVIWLHGLWILGLALAIPPAAWAVRSGQALRDDPAQEDERARDLAARATRVGWTLMLQTALLGGLADYMDIFALSGTQVGFAAGAMGILGALTAQAWLEWRDAV